MTHHFSRRTKIVATLGPATDQPGMLGKIIAAGVNVVRLNFSHGSHASQLARMQAVREEAKKQNCIIGILADLQGPKIRVANFEQGKVHLQAGASFILDAAFDSEKGNEHCVGIDYKDLPKDVKVGDTLLLDDGRLEFLVKQVAGTKITCEVIVGGILSNHKGINRRGGGLTAPALTEKDKEDLKFAILHEVDFIAISFPRNAQDMLYAKELVVKAGGHAGLIAKIERTEAVPAIDEIIEVSDGVMVARGDLAVEIGDAQVPSVQRLIIQRARILNKPVIVATQMMESMINSTVPTRAEVSDVATAVLENADAVMLSAETAAGDHPDLVVESMARICIAAELQPDAQVSGHRVECNFQRVDEAIAMATMYTANHLPTKAVIALTESGTTPLLMSRIRTAMPIFGLSRFRQALGRMSLYRGVYPIQFNVTEFTRDEVNRASVQALQNHYDVKFGDVVILTKGDNMGVGGGTNAMKILTVGEVA